MDFFLTASNSEALLGHVYDGWLVALSFAIGTAGSALSLYVAHGAAKTHEPRARALLLAVGATTFGLAVWSMHFIGMLAFSICASVDYDAVTTLLSALPAIAAAWMVLRGLRPNDSSLPALTVKGSIVGAGIGVMHYSGMMAMRTAASLRFDPFDFAISIAAAIMLSTAALWSRQRLLKRLPLKWASSLSALIMGVAITTIHYVAMAAARFTGQTESAFPMPPSDRLFLSVLITIGIASLLGFAGFGVLMSRLKESLAELAIRGKELDAIIQNSIEAIVITNPDGSIKAVNKTFESVFGYANADVVGEHISAFLPRWPALLNDAGDYLPQETLGMRNNDSEFPIRVALARLQTDTVAFYVGFINDISEIKRIQAKLLHDANHDFLTGLHNRRHFKEQLVAEVERTRRTASPVSLLMVDIDHFKRINDTYGHLIGDRVLVMVASTLQAASRREDSVARYGGEEFLLLLPDTGPVEAHRLAERLRAAIAQLDLRHEGERIAFTISIGIASSTGENALTPQSLIGKADDALYRAKDMGRNRVELFLEVVD